MTRLDQALRWWRNQKCECDPGQFPTTHLKIVSEKLIPDPHFRALSLSGKLVLAKEIPPTYYLRGDPSPLCHSAK